MDVDAVKDGERLTRITKRTISFWPRRIINYAIHKRHETALVYCVHPFNSIGGPHLLWDENLD